jgi:hypothetical protein
LACGANQIDSLQESQQTNSKVLDVFSCHVGKLFKNQSFDQN